MNAEELNRQFALPGRLTFSTGEGGWPYALMTHEEATARVSLYGAHVLSFIPTGNEDLLWMAGKCIFQEGKAIRGGIPVCWPWFGPHPSDPTKPAHGFARLSLWEVAATVITHEGEVQLTLQLLSSPRSEQLWPFAFSAALTVTVGKTLNVELAVTNTGNEHFTYTDALHSYLRIGDIEKVTVEGLRDALFYDWTEGNALKKQQETLLPIHKEENRRYAGTTATCTIHDPVLRRKIHIAKTGSHTTVLWNPWIETSKTFADMAANDYQTMLCIEAANAFDETITLKPGESYRLGTQLSITH